MLKTKVVRNARALPWLLLFLTALCVSSVRADTLRKRYDFDYNKITRLASLQVATAQARKMFLRDFLAAKFAPEVIQSLAEDIDVALDPSDQFLSTFNVVSERLNEDQTRVTLTVEGEVDFPEMINALVANKVLSFGNKPARVMVLPSSRFEDPSAAKALRALIYGKIKDAGLRPVAAETAGTSVSFRIKDNVVPNGIERQAMVKTAMQSNADYLIYIDTTADVRPFQSGGYIADTTFIHTILRPNGSLILGESITSERGSGSTAGSAFDNALDSVAPVIAKNVIAQLYQAIYSDSDVLYNTPRLQSKSLLVNPGGKSVVPSLAERLRNDGASVTVGAEMADGISRLSVQTTMDDSDLYEWLNRQKYSVGGKNYTTPVVAYSDNKLEVEAITDQVAPKRAPLIKAPPRSVKRPSSMVAMNFQGKLVLNLRSPIPN